jgi:small subunit ribosomal protein S1
MNTQEPLEPTSANPQTDLPADDAESAPNAASADVASQATSASVASTEPASTTEAAASTEVVPQAHDEESSAPTVTLSASEESGVPSAAGDGEEVHATSGPATDSTGKIKSGQLIEGIVKVASPTEVVVDLGDGLTGLLASRELERLGSKVNELLKVDGTITVFVLNPRTHQGQILLSINRAQEELDWKQAEEYYKSETVYEGVIAGYNKGGMIVRFGRLRGFVPQSQIADDRRQRIAAEQERYEEMVNKPIMVKVVEVDRARNRLILSERAATREARERRKAALVNELQVGDVRVGRVVSLEDFGAFVDVGGAEGLVHLTELSWKHVTHPREVLRVGQEVKAEVISVDPKRKRIGLSVKRQLADPWDEIASTYENGQLVRATITKLTKFGAFARLVDAPDIEGLIHISELSDQRVAHPKEVVNESDTLTLRVVKIDVVDRRLGLSLKRVNSAEYLDKDWGRSPLSPTEAPAEPHNEAPTDAPAEPHNEAPTDAPAEPHGEAPTETPTDGE